MQYSSSYSYPSFNYSNSNSNSLPKIRRNRRRSSYQNSSSYGDNTEYQHSYKPNKFKSNKYFNNDNNNYYSSARYDENNASARNNYNHPTRLKRGGGQQAEKNNHNSSYYYYSSKISKYDQNYYDYDYQYNNDNNLKDKYYNNKDHIYRRSYEDNIYSRDYQDQNNYDNQDENLYLYDYHDDDINDQDYVHHYEQDTLIQSPNEHYEDHKEAEQPYVSNQLNSNNPRQTTDIEDQLDVKATNNPKENIEDIEYTKDTNYNYHELIMNPSYRDQQHDDDEDDDEEDLTNPNRKVKEDHNSGVDNSEDEIKSTEKLANLCELEYHNYKMKVLQHAVMMQQQSMKVKKMKLLVDNKVSLISKGIPNDRLEDLLKYKREYYQVKQERSKIRQEIVHVRNFVTECEKKLNEITNKIERYQKKISKYQTLDEMGRVIVQLRQDNVTSSRQIKYLNKLFQELKQRREIQQRLVSTLHTDDNQEKSAESQKGDEQKMATT